jgi:hypothetical protein
MLDKFKDLDNRDLPVLALQWDGLKKSYKTLIKELPKDSIVLKGENLWVKTPWGFNQVALGDYVIFAEGDVFKADPNFFETLYKKE